MKQKLSSTLGAIAALSLVGWGQVAQAADPAQLDQLRRTKKCPGCDLSYAKLRGVNLSGADLSGANLNVANLRGANLSGANLTGANLNLTDLTRTNLTGANLTQATLVFARLRRTTFDNANLTSAILGGLERFAHTRSFQDAILPNGTKAFAPPARQK
ncbi:MAG: pentapeptide repeat-containing protein [Aphanocapsa sp. GSE-SYN-MK-11-07L]|jgi:uncharacterized protein YjbI with pentapeptide repeats|nr:pentapeptide repeat-containing protein [Aphanocapsa sp. GSE-SYN-MK-11-07L]